MSEKVSGAQAAASARYRKAHVNQIIVRFYPKERELYEHVRAQGEGMAPYVKRLIREDMERGR